ncbi:hypothetical protein RYJ27_02065 [Microbacterium limosum]|uniref:Uncharacterized protein n=1 Tax=Microbacterium limosum TaxID=3079935 RepID=A0AAU0MIH5_9MICO|nr:hypothetical protein [Microbacterium sp. Y20]WOQ70036.1 hypothetical protein RYJ27_02065 [Microbacterium sp. Y20]
MSENTQDEPSMAQHDTTDAARLAGVVDQTRADVGGKDADAVEHVLRERLAQTGIELPDADVHDIAGRLSRGERWTPAQTSS